MENHRETERFENKGIGETKKILEK